MVYGHRKLDVSTGANVLHKDRLEPTSCEKQDFSHILTLAIIIIEQGCAFLTKIGNLLLI